MAGRSIHTRCHEARSETAQSAFINAAGDGTVPPGTFGDLVCYFRDKRHRPRVVEESVMLSWALTFLVIALIAAVLGFGGIAGVSIEIAKIIFFVAILLFVISAIFGVVRGRRTVP
jgi:uncharacterized membrane protein YtjA (UPF0391 family)